MCIRGQVNDLFMLSADKDYSVEERRMECLQVSCTLFGTCDCSSCACCSSCLAQCPCEYSSKDENTFIEELLGLGDENYMYVKNLFQHLSLGISSDEEKDSESSDEDSFSQEAVDDFEFSLDDLSPQIDDLSALSQQWL